MAAVTTIALIIAFQLLTAPVASHMVGRASHRIGLLDTDRLSRNDLED